MIRSASVLDTLRQWEEAQALQQQFREYSDRSAPAMDVLQGRSLAVPRGALRMGAGALAGGALGQILGTLTTPGIDPKMRTQESDAIRARRRRLARIGALLGLAGTGAVELAPAIKEKLAI